jgi:hypothetical protein
MDEYRVPTVQVPAEVFWVDGRTLDGIVFMPEQSAVHAGPMRPVEWINRDTRFFPFRVGDAGRGMLVNKRQVVAIAVPHDAVAEGSDPDIDVPVRHVIVEAAGREFKGRVLIDMPISQQRLVDYMNRDERFFLLRGNGRDYLLHKDHVVRVREAEGEE